MPITAMQSPDRLQLRVQVGTDPEDGTPIYRLRTYNDVNTEVSDEDLHQVADQMGDLSDDGTDSIRRIKQFDLVDMP